MPRKLDLPVELEREIFELAAKADVRTALRLAIVARRVQVWVEPIIYSRVVVAHAPAASLQLSYAHDIQWERSARGRRSKKAPQIPVLRFIRTIPFRPASFFARHVKQLLLGNLTEPELVTVLSTCTGIAELGWWSSTATAPVMAALATLKIDRLSVDRSFDLLAAATPAAAMFANVTHLDITMEPDDYNMPALPPLQSFRSLTHFSMVFGRFLPASPENWLNEVLKARPSLNILVLFSDRIHNEQIAGLRPRNPDPRVVVMLPPVGEWTARWVHDAWPLAEEVVRERHKLAAAEKAAADAASQLEA
ncbi:hypothetical protein C8R43DRAFT_1040472 [Mycena crocata]|nr:hypothetical protein C8R43DRAFT_1040472 [Mycena crocata]